MNTHDADTDREVTHAERLAIRSLLVNYQRELNAAVLKSKCAHCMSSGALQAEKENSK